MNTVGLWTIDWTKQPIIFWTKQLIRIIRKINPPFTKTFIHFDIFCLSILYSHAGSLFVSCFIVSGQRWIMSQKRGWLITIQRC